MVSNQSMFQPWANEVATAPEAIGEGLIINLFRNCTLFQYSNLVIAYVGDV